MLRVREKYNAYSALESVCLCLRGVTLFFHCEWQSAREVSRRTPLMHTASAQWLAKVHFKCSIYCCSFADLHKPLANDDDKSVRYCNLAFVCRRLPRLHCGHSIMNSFMTVSGTSSEFFDDDSCSMFIEIQSISSGPTVTTFERQKRLSVAAIVQTMFAFDKVIWSSDKWNIKCSAL